MNDVPARMVPEEKKPVFESLFDSDMWFLSVLEEREQAAVKLAYEYARMGQPGLPNHMYLKVIHRLSEILRQVPVELVEDGAN